MHYGVEHVHVEPIRTVETRRESGETWLVSERKNPHASQDARRLREITQAEQSGASPGFNPRRL